MHAESMRKHGNLLRRCFCSNGVRSRSAGTLISARRQCTSGSMQINNRAACCGRTCAVRRNARSATARWNDGDAFPTGSSLRDRPAIVDKRKRIGDWEADTVIGKNHRQAIVSIVERKTGLTLIRKVERKTAQAVSQAMIELMKPYRNRVHTITSDNEKEFAGHEVIAKQLQADFYFAHPYASWERRTNENTNGLIRQYFPKNRDFTTITQQEIDTAMERLNNRPRKRLGYQTPNQVFFKSGVALQI